MPLNALAQKLKIVPGQRLIVVNAPDGYLRRLEPLPETVTLARRLQGQFDWIQLFVQRQAELRQFAPKVAVALKPVSRLWVCFPKGASKIQTDLTRDHGWEALQPLNLKWITLISIDDTWSAFSLRPYQPGEARQSFR